MNETTFAASVVRAHPNGRILEQSGSFPDGLVAFRLGQDLVRVPTSKGKFHGRMQVTRGSTTKYLLYREGRLVGDAPGPRGPGPAAKPEAKSAPRPGAPRRCSLCGEEYALLADHVRTCVGGG